MSTTTKEALPIAGVADAIIFLERRCEKLADRIRERKEKGLNASFDEKELHSIRKGIIALKLHRDEAEDEDRATLALSAVLDLLDQMKAELVMKPDMRREVESATSRIRTLVGNIGG